MKIRFRKPNGKWKTLYSGLSERKAKDLLHDIRKNLAKNGLVLNFSEDGEKLAGVKRTPQGDIPVEYALHV